MTLVSPPHLPQVHCSGAQAMILLDTFQMCRQFVAAGMMLATAPLLVVSRCCSRPLPGSGPRSISASISSLDTARFKIEQLQLQIRQLLAALAVLLDALQAKLFFELLDQHLRQQQCPIFCGDRPVSSPASTAQ